MKKRDVSTYGHFKTLTDQRYSMRLGLILILFVHAWRLFLRLLIGRRRREKYFTRQRKTLREKPSRFDWAFLLRVPFKHAMIRRWVNHEPEVTALLKDMRGGLFVDIGVNTCWFPMLLKDNFERMIGFEADPEIYAWVKGNIEIPQLEVFNYAVSDHVGEIYLHRNPLSLYGGASTVANYHWQGVKVECITLDEFFSHHTMRDLGIDLVKMDVEGAEWQVLEGSKKIMARVGAWVVELHDPNRKQELVDLMKGYGYETRWIDDYNLHDRRVIWNPHLYAWRA